MNISSPIILSSQIQFQELSMTERESTCTDITDVSQDNVTNGEKSRRGGLLGRWSRTRNESTTRESLANHRRANNIDYSDDGLCWLNPPDEPWTPYFYLSERGLDNIHIYFWITKDLCWVQSWFIAGVIIGSMACLYALFLTFRAAIWRKSISEFWIKMSEFMWLFSNFWWMIGELHDDHHGYFEDHDKSIVDEYTHQAGIMFIATLIWISLYYIILKPMELLDDEDDDLLKDGDGSCKLKPRFPFYFKSWNEYENIHIFFWVGKDTAWNWWIQSMWLVFFIPTLFIGIDFVYLTIKSKRLMIDHAHYFAQFLWVVANAVWAGGEFWFTPDNDSAIPIGRFSSEARHTSRWYSSWVVLASYLPLISLYILWLYYTFFGVIPPVKKANNNEKDAGRQSDKMYESGTSQHSGNDLVDASSLPVSNPLIPVRQVNVQSHGLSNLSTASASMGSKSSFKVTTLKKALNHDEGNDVGHSDTDEIRFSELSNTTGVLHGAEL